MSTNEPKLTPVIFRRLKSNGAVIALFPEEAGSTNSADCLCYMHIGQHGTAAIDLMMGRKGAATLAASIDEADVAELKAELEELGYVLDVKTRNTRTMREKRRQEIATLVATLHPV